MNMNPFDMLKQMGSLNAQMEQVKGEMNKLTATGSAGAGMVEISINGLYQVLKVTISPDMLQFSKDTSTLEVLIASAFNDASGKIKQSLEDLTKSKLAGFGIKK